MDGPSTSVVNGRHSSLASIFSITHDDRPKLEKALFKVICSFNARSPSKSIEDAVRDIADKVIDGSLTVSPTKSKPRNGFKEGYRVKRAIECKIYKKPGRKRKCETEGFQSNFNPRTLAMVKNARASGPLVRRASVDHDSNSSAAQGKVHKRRNILCKKRKDRRTEQRTERLALLASKPLMLDFSGYSESELGTKFRESAQFCILTFGLEPLDAYYTLIECLQHYYSSTTWQGSVNSLSSQFLHKLLIASDESDMNNCLDVRDFDFITDISSPEQQLLILRLEILLIFRSFLDSQLNISQELIIGKVADRLTARPFDGETKLETIVEEVSNEFIDTLPRHVCLLYDNMNLPKPVDLETMESEEEEEEEDVVAPQTHFNVMSLSHLSNGDKSRSSSITNDNIFERFHNSKSPVSRRSSGEGTKYSDWCQKQQKKNMKGMKKEEVNASITTNGLEHSDDDDASSNSSRLSPRKHASTLALRKTKVFSYIDMVKEKTKRAMAVKSETRRGNKGQSYPRTSTPALLYDDSMPILDSSVLTNGDHSTQPTPQPSPRPRRKVAPIRQNHNSILMDKCNAPKKGLNSPSPRGTVKRKATSPLDSHLPSKRAPSLESQVSKLSSECKSDVSSFEIASEAIDVYRRHSAKINQKGKKKDDGGLFYSRGTTKINVFDPPEEESHPRWNLRKKAEAKSRSGRKVRAGEGVSHVANYLLNTFNSKPNSPVIPRNMARKLSSPFKLKKSLRLPSRSRSKQLKKMLACSTKIEADRLNASTEQLMCATVSLPNLSDTFNCNLKNTIKTNDEKRLLECLLSPRFYKNSCSKERNSSRTCSESEDVGIIVRRSPRHFTLNDEDTPRVDDPLGNEYPKIRSNSPILD